MSVAEPEQAIGHPRAPAAAEIRQGVTRLSRRLRAERSPGGLSSTKLTVLSHLLRGSPATAGEVAAADRAQPQSLTRVLAELERDGLITRTRDDQDRRQSLLAITGAGRLALRRDMAQRDEWLASALTGLTSTECEVLRLAARLMDRIADTTETPSLPRQTMALAAPSGPGTLIRLAGNFLVCAGWQARQLGYKPRFDATTRSP